MFGLGCALYGRKRECSEAEREGRIGISKKSMLSESLMSECVVLHYCSFIFLMTFSWEFELTLLRFLGK